MSPSSPAAEPAGAPAAAPAGVLPGLGRARPDPVVAGLLGLFAVVSLLFLLPVPLGLRAGLWWTALVGVHAVLVRYAWQARVRARARPNERWLWGAFAVAGSFYLVGDLVQLVLLAVGPVTVPTAIGAPPQALLAALGTSVLVVKLLVMPVGASGAREHARFWLDVGIVVSAAVAGGAYLLLPVSPPATGTALGQLLIGPVVFATGTFVVVKLALSPQRPFGGAAGGLLAGSGGIEAVLQAVWPRLVDDGRLDVLFAGHLLANVMLALAARLELLRDPADASRDRPRRLIGSVLPYVALAAVQGLLLRALAAEGLTPRVWFVVIGASAGTALVVVRQVDTVLETSRLVRDLDQRVVQLDAALAERDRLAERLQHAAQHDVLTGLGNRTLFVAELEEALATPEAGVTLLLVDLDDFKPVNDRLGHGAGDRLLVQVADRLRLCADRHPVCRLGGDEFAVVVRGDRDEAEKVADAVVEALSWVYRLPAGPAVVGVSIGGAVVGPDTAQGALTADTVVQVADTALYAVKRTGKGRYRLVDAVAPQQ